MLKASLLFRRQVGLWCIGLLYQLEVCKLINMLFLRKEVIELMAGVILTRGCGRSRGKREVDIPERREPHLLVQG